MACRSCRPDHSTVKKGGILYLVPWWKMWTLTWIRQGDASQKFKLLKNPTRDPLILDDFASFWNVQEISELWNSSEKSPGVCSFWSTKGTQPTFNENWLNVFRAVPDPSRKTIDTAISVGFSLHRLQLGAALCWISFGSQTWQAGKSPCQWRFLAGKIIHQWWISQPCGWLLGIFWRKLGAGI